MNRYLGSVGEIVLRTLLLTAFLLGMWLVCSMVRGTEQAKAPCPAAKLIVESLGTVCLIEPAVFNSTVSDWDIKKGDEKIIVSVEIDIPYEAKEVSAISPGLLGILVRPKWSGGLRIVGVTGNKPLDPDFIGPDKDGDYDVCVKGVVPSGMQKLALTLILHNPSGGTPVKTSDVKLYMMAFWPVEHPCPALESRHSRIMDRLAQQHANSMAKRRYQDHQGFGGRAAEVRDTLGVREVSEICAESWPRQCDDPPEQIWAEFVRCWKQSHSHWRTAGQRHRYIGAAVAKGKDGRWFGCLIAGN